MRKLIVSAAARSDLRKIRRYTVSRHGHNTADTHDALLKPTLRDIRDDPFRSGSHERPEIGENIRSYHSSLSRDRAGSTIKSPRHFVLYFLPDEDAVAVSRVLHDSRDPARHVPDKHLEQASSRGFTRNTPPRGQGHDSQGEDP